MLGVLWCHTQVRVDLSGANLERADLREAQFREVLPSLLSTIWLCYIVREARRVPRICHEMPFRSARPLVALSPSGYAMLCYAIL